MSDVLLPLIGLSLFAGSAIFWGALLGWWSEKKPNLISCEFEHGILAFGGGALISAVGLVLVPEGLDIQPVGLAAVTFLLGGIIFLFLDRWLHKKDTPLSQLTALLLDFIPEVIVLGASIAMDMKMAIFLAVIIAAQNLPEGFSAFREIIKSREGFLEKHVLTFMGILILLGPAAALFGFYICEKDDLTLGMLMTFCAGGILYLVFRDIAPSANVKDSWYPSFGAVMGFGVGLIGFGLTH